MNGNNIQFRISAIDDFSRNMNQFQKSVNNMSDSTRQMADKMKTAYSQTKAVMDEFKGQQMGVQYEFFKLGQSSDEYAGKTNELMNEIQRLGKTQKTINDNMINSNKLLKAEMYSTAGAILNLSTQAEKISSNYDRMGNAMYNVNKGSLAVVDGLNKIANSGRSAVLALKLLGPTANMKELLDMQRMINQGLTRFAAVAVAAAVTSALVYGALHKGAMETVAGYEEAFNRMKSSVREAFQPMVDVFGAVMIHVYNFINAIAQLTIKFNEAHPILAKIIQGIMMLVPILTLLLSPLAIGIGLLAGFKAALAFIWPMIAPLVTGLAAMSATVWIVAAAIVGLVAAFIVAYNKIEWFRNMVDAVWAWIKSAWNAAITFIAGITKTVMAKISAFFGEQLAKIQAFWNENGHLIMKFVNSFMNTVKTDIQAGMLFIKGIFQVVWPIISGAVKIAWELIKAIVGTGIDILLGLISAGMKLMEGDWKGAWESIEQIGIDIWNNIESFFENIDLVQIGKDIIQGLIDGIGSMAGAITSKVSSLAALVPKGLTDFLNINSPSRLIRDKVGKFIPMGLAEGITGSLGVVKKAVTGMAAMAVPQMSTPNYSAQRVSNGAQSRPSVTNNTPVNITLNYSGSASRDDVLTMADLLDAELAKRTRYEARIGGVKGV